MIYRSFYKKPTRLAITFPGETWWDDQRWPLSRVKGVLLPLIALAQLWEHGRHHFRRCDSL